MLIWNNNNWHYTIIINDNFIEIINYNKVTFYWLEICRHKRREGGVAKLLGWWLLGVTIFFIIPGVSAVDMAVAMVTSTRLDTPTTV